MTAFQSSSSLQSSSTPILDVGDLYAGNYHWLLTWLSKKLACPFDAADLAQDTFVKIAHSNNVGTIKTPRAFLTTTATRLIIDLLRKRNIERKYLEMLYQQQANSFIATPQQIKESIETLNEIAALLEGLPEKVYRAFLMCRLDGLSYTEIGKELGVSTSMVKQYIARAMVHCYQVAYADERGVKRK